MPPLKVLAAVGLAAVVAAILGVVLGAHRLPLFQDSPRASTVRDDDDAARGGSLAALPMAALFVAVGGADGGSCSRSAPCGSFDAAYHAAKPGQVVEIAAGDYGDQALTPDPGKTGVGCESRAALGACVVLTPAPGATVRVRGLNFGKNYKNAGPAGVAVVGSGPGRRLLAVSTNFLQAREVVVSGVDQQNIYVTGGHDIAIRGGRIGGQSSPDGTHPEIQGVYGADPAIVPTRLTIEGVDFHDINTTSKTAHVDCLQIESGQDIVVKGNTFRRCGSTGLRISYGGGANENPPSRLRIEDNWFGKCADTPVSPCYYAAQLGIGHDVLVRGNKSEQLLQPTGDPSQMSGVRYEGNTGPGITCEAGITYVRNAWVSEACGATDRRIAPKALTAALGAGAGAVPSRAG